jgi:hypothetical protein
MKLTDFKLSRWCRNSDEEDDDDGDGGDDKLSVCGGHMELDCNADTLEECATSMIMASA